ncbi:MAG: hypothetical protein WDA09_02790 [Bacteriovoracaceae bacterium]
MNKFIFTITCLLFVNDLLACPYCVGSTQDGKDSNTTLVLGIFILAIYIPYIIIYRLIKKHDAFRAQMMNDHDSSRSPNS